MNKATVKKASPSVGRDFGGVEIVLHPSQARHEKAVRQVVPGASVSVGPDMPMWGARILSRTSEGHYALTFFWDAGYLDVKRCLGELGVVTEWID